MASIYENLQNDRQYSASTGLNKAKFDELYQQFKCHYIPKKVNIMTGQLPLFYDSREALFFVLYYLKVYPTLQVYGLTFGISDFSASDNYDYIIPYLKITLKENSSFINRIFENQSCFEKAFENVGDIYIDGTEIGIERSKDKQVQKDSYSGKKNSIPLFCL